VPDSDAGTVLLDDEPIEPRARPVHPPRGSDRL